MTALLVHAFDLLLMLQATQASLTGTVRDAQTGAPLAHAVVTLTDLERSALTDARGRYLLRDVPPGPQHMGVQRLGYAARTVHAIVPREGTLEIHVSLNVEPIPLSSVEVRPQLALRGVDYGGDAGVPDRAASSSAVRNHPLLAEPDVLHALGGGEVVIRPEAAGGVHIRGGASDQTAYLLDGVPVFSPYHAAGMFSAWNPDAVARVELSAAAPAGALPNTVSGAISATTVTPGTHWRAQGSASTTQARATVDGPLGVLGGGLLLSLRSGLPDLFAPRRDPSYLRGESGDWLAKIEAPLFGGIVRLLGYENENELDVANAAHTSDAPQPEPGRNEFAWQSRSLGATWARAAGRTTLRAQLWRADGRASSTWAAASGAAVMKAARRDYGAATSLERATASARSSVGMRIEQVHTTYGFATAGAQQDPGAQTSAPVTTLFLQHDRLLASRTSLQLGTALAFARGGAHVSPRVQLRWRAGNALTLTGSYARLHQFAQSVRNTESVVGNIFPADLYAAAGGNGVPVAHSEQAALAAELRPVSGMRLSVQAFTRAFDGLVLVAAGEDEPFASGPIASGSGTAHGAALDAVFSSARLALITSYGLHRVRLRHAGGSYVPEHGTTHVLETGVMVFPSATWSVRAGMAGGLGRRTTQLVGGFEWEACNLLDSGCEFGGSPRSSSHAPGATRLPGYLRVDVGARKHWHVRAGGRDVAIALFGTVTNLFGRRNLLTYARDPADDERVAIEMRPLSPLVVGLDWRF